MEKNIRYKYFKNEYEDRVSNKLFIKFLIVLFIFYFILIVCFQTFFTNYTYVTILGQSMRPTLNKKPCHIEYDDYENKQYVQDGVYLKYTQDIDYNDIVVIDARYQGLKDTIIKRALAFGGDYITIAKVQKEGKLYGEYRFMRRKKNSAKIEILEEKYILDYSEWSLEAGIKDENDVVYEKSFYVTLKLENNYPTQTFPVSLDGGQSQTEVVFFKVPDNHLFFMGDNRSHSTDAREAPGPVEMNKVVGKVVEIVPNGTKYPNNGSWWWHRVVGFINVVWKEILRFFGAHISI